MENIDTTPLRNPSQRPSDVNEAVLENASDNEVDEKVMKKPEEKSGGKATTTTTSPSSLEHSVLYQTALACQTLRHHISMSLKLISDLYVQYGERKEEALKDSSDSVALGIIMVNSSLLKGLHVVDSLQGSCVRKYPEFNRELEDHLLSFDGSLTTIYEGHQSQTLRGKLMKIDEVNAALKKEKENHEKELKTLEERCRELQSALEDSRKSRPVTAETCVGSNSDPVISSGNIIIDDSEDGDGKKGKGKNGATKEDAKTIALPEDELARLVSIIQRLSARLTATRLELGELKRRGFAEAASTQRKNSGRDGVDRGLSRRPYSASSSRHGLLGSSPEYAKKKGTSQASNKS